MKLVGLRTEQERRPRIAEAYVPTKLRSREGSIESELSTEQIIQSSNCSVILGDPGAGKSTLLDHLVLTFSEPIKTSLWIRASQMCFLPLTSKTRLPFYVPLRRCLAKNKTLLDDILDADTGILPEPIREKIPKDFLKRCVKRQEAVILLDGLDEVANDDAYRAVVEKINDFIQIFPHNTVLVTCRKAGWRGGIQPEPPVFFTLPLDFQQQYEFVHKWYAAILQYVAYDTGVERHELRRKAEREADHLLSFVRAKERLRELASNPLLLGLICLVHRQKKDLPRGRARLYEECIDILLFHWDQIDKDLDQSVPSSAQKKELLRRVSHRMHTDGLKEIGRGELEDLVREIYPELLSDQSAAALIRQIEVRSGLMSERSIDRLAFSHLTFQEFLVVDYIRERPGYDVASVDISEQRWREPLLLMSGLERDATRLISIIFQKDPILAVYAMAEADPAHLEAKEAGRLLDQLIERSLAGEIPLTEAVAAIVGLISVEGNPFQDAVLRFIYSSIRRDTTTGIDEIIETLSNTQTRATARVLLSLLKESELRERADLVIAGLARIGDPAIYETIDASARGTIDEAQLTELLLLCESPASTQALWSRYQLTPPVGREVRWAQAWARRLASPETDRMLSRETSPLPPLYDVPSWPYRVTDNSAIAALVSKVVEVLERHYAREIDILKDINAVSNYSLRVQIPLILAKGRREISYSPQFRMSEEVLIHWGVPVPEDPWEQQELVQERVWTALHLRQAGIIHMRRHTGLVLPVHSSGMVSALQYGNSFNPHMWRTLKGFLTQKRGAGRKLLGQLGVILGLCILAITCLSASMGIRALLPTNGTYIEFWRWLPSWCQIGIPALLFISMGWLAYKVSNETFDSEFFAVFTVGLLLTGLFLLVPFIFLMAPIVALGPQVIEEAVSTGKLRWGSIGFACFLGTGAASLAAVGSRPWLSTVSLVWMIIALGLFTLFGMFLYCRAMAFRRNEIATWLRTHPRGREVLNEFNR